jgi:hypothetical protein
VKDTLAGRLLASNAERQFMPTPASPGTNQFRCDACGRYFNSESELREHEKSCQTAKATGAVNTEKHPEAGHDQGEDREWVSTP